jgi:hypothetical protein
MSREYDYCRTPALTSEQAEDTAASSGGVVIGILLSVGAGAMLAASMNVQQYALTNSKLKEKSRYRVWLGGLFLYCFAQLICTGALSFCPLSLVSSLFTTMLLWDALIGRVFFKKILSYPAMVGLAIIFTAVVLVAVFGPREEYAITNECIVYWIKSPSGILAIVTLVMLFIANYSVYIWFTKNYPYFRVIDSSTGKRMEEEIKCSRKIKKMMQFVYPAILAVTETVGSLCLKAVSAMVFRAVSQEDYSSLASAEFFILMFVYIGAVVSIMMW